MMQDMLQSHISTATQSLKRVYALQLLAVDGSTGEGVTNKCLSEYGDQELV